MTVVEKWLENGFVSQEFVSWVQDETKVSFPWSMIDKITPRPAKVVEESLAAAGIENMAPIVTSKNTFIAPFVNAEQPQYLVIEDRFPNGRPPLEKAGAYMPQPTAHRAGGLWLPAWLRLNRCRDEGPRAESPG